MMAFCSWLCNRGEESYSEWCERFYTRMAGNGIFVDERSAHQVMNDGKEFLDLASPTIHPAVQINLPRY